MRVKVAGKYWRLDYRIGGKPQTLALGVYPEVSLRRPANAARRPVSNWLMASTHDAKREERRVGDEFHRSERQLERLAKKYVPTVGFDAEGHECHRDRRRVCEGTGSRTMRPRYAFISPICRVCWKPTRGRVPNGLSTMPSGY